MPSLCSSDHSLLSGLGESEVVDGIGGPVAAEQVAHHVQVAELGRVDQGACLRFVNLRERISELGSFESFREEKKERSAL